MIKSSMGILVTAHAPRAVGVALREDAHGAIDEGHDPPLLFRPRPARREDLLEDVLEVKAAL